MANIRNERLLKLLLAAVTALFLVAACLVRSRVLVDASLMPRYAATALLLAIVMMAMPKFRLGRPAFLLAILIALWYAWNLLSALWSVAPAETLVQAQLILTGLAVFLTAGSLDISFNRFRKVFLAVFPGVLAFSFFLAFRRMAALEFFDPYRLVALSANNNLYAGFLLLSLPLLFAGYSGAAGWQKYLWVSGAAMTVFFLVILQSRAAYLGMLLAVLVSSVFMVRFYRNKLTRQNLVAVGVALFLVGAGLVIFHASLDPPRRAYFLNKIAVWNYFRTYTTPGTDSLFRTGHHRIAANTDRAEFDFSEAYHENAGMRMIFWRKSLCLIAQHPLAGVGAGNWRLNIPSCKEPPNPEHTARNFTYSQPHNEWVAFTSELGIIGLALTLLLFLGAPVAVLWRSMESHGNLPVTTMLSAAFLAGFWLYASFDFPLHRVEHNVVLFILLAFMANDSRAVFGFSRPEVTVPAPVRIILVAGLFFTVFLAMIRIHGEYFTLKMFRNEGRNNRLVIEYCRKAENPFYRITPNTLPLAWFEGVALYREGDPFNALACFDRALRSTPFEVRVMNDRAAALYTLGRQDEAKQDLQKALSFDPFFDDARFNLGAIHYASGNSDSAVWHFSRCRDGEKKRNYLEEAGKSMRQPQ